MAVQNYRIEIFQADFSGRQNTGLKLNMVNLFVELHQAVNKRNAGSFKGIKPALV